MIVLKSTRAWWWGLACALSLLTLTMVDTHAARVRELGLADMAGRADRIFVGVCTSRNVHDDNAGGRAYTTYVFRVTEPIKGVAEPTVTFSVAATPDGRGFTGLPVYSVGEHRLLLLYPDGASGRTSPMGLDQGSFRLVHGRDGTMFAVNGRSNQGLFRDIPPGLMEAHGVVDRTGGRVTRAALVRVIESLVDAGRP